MPTFRGQVIEYLFLSRPLYSGLFIYLHVPPDRSLNIRKTLQFLHEDKLENWNNNMNKQFHYSI